MIFRSIGLFGRYQDPAVKVTLTAIKEHLERRGRVVFLGDTTHHGIEDLRLKDSGKPLHETIELGIVIGGAD